MGVVRDLDAAGHLALFAGGCVRDAALGRPVHDIDIATSARPEQVEEVFRGRTIPVGKSFGVVVVKTPHHTFEIATFRADGEYTDGRRPDSIRYANAEADAQRRDFTINGLFYNPLTDERLDYVGGLAVLKRRVVRAIGVPAERFAEDKLRMLRAVRFASVLGFDLDPATAEAIREAAPRVRSVSAERIGAEFTRMLVESLRPSRMLEMLHDLRLLPVFLPEIEAMRGVRQPPQFHPEGDVWTHTCMMLDRIPAPRDPDLAYGALLHDVGKPRTTVVTTEPDGSSRIRSPNHADVGGDMVPDILRRLRQPAARIETVEAMVRRHMTFPSVPQMRKAKQRRFLGAPTFPLDFQLFELDTACSTGDPSLVETVRAIADEYAKEPALPPPLVMGRDLLAAGFQPGPGMATLLRRLYDAQLEDPSLTKGDLLAQARAGQDLPT